YATGILSDLTEDMEDEKSSEDGDVFERLSDGQKVAAILTVAKALLDPATEAPEITAEFAATVSAIYDYLETAINIEMDASETTVRKTVLDALDEWAHRSRWLPKATTWTNGREWLRYCGTKRLTITISKWSRSFSTQMCKCPKGSATMADKRGCCDHIRSVAG